MSNWLPEDDIMKALALLVLVGCPCATVVNVASMYLDAQRSERLLEQCSHQLTACIAKAPVCR